MNKIPRNFLLRSLLGLSLVAGGIATPALAAPVDCNAPRSSAEARGCAAATQGIGPVRRYVERTRTIYAFTVSDFAAAVQRAEIATAEARERLASAR